MPTLAKCKSIIFDLRGYPAIEPDLISHLLTIKDTSKNWLRIPQIIYPDEENIAGYINSGWDLIPKKPHLGAKIIFITDASAISYAESFMSFIDYYKLGTIIGQPTAGTNGDINPFTLPGDYSITWTGTKVFNHDGSQHHGIGIQPNILVSKTIKGVREGRDEFLEKAIELANE
jgi:C-terminal processing protease CtpA/Prc